MQGNESDKVRSSATSWIAFVGTVVMVLGVVAYLAVGLVF